MVVTGAASGIGKESTEAFADEGATVVAVDVDEDAVTEFASSVDAEGTVEPVPADVSDPETVESVFETVAERHSGLDVLFNNAGVPHEPTPAEDLDVETWNRVVDINLKGAFLCVKFGLPLLERDSGGAILNTASTAGLRPRPGHLIYSISKGGLITMTRALAVEVADRGVRVNALCPVATDTPFLREATGDDWDVDDLRDTIPLGRLATPEDVADAALFLASDGAGMLTGLAVPIDGGFTI